MDNNSNKPWKYALVQHPMWLIIAEDMVCAERTPPWGLPSLEMYAERLDKCLDTLEKYPQLHLNFDFSAVELEDLAERFPDLMSRIRQFTSEGRLSFLNGTYSQPHLQILSIESAIRQYEYGLKGIENLTGCRVVCYAAQEPGFSPQLPQILRAFGYETASTPSFPFGVKIMSGRIQHWDGRWEWLEGDDLVCWRGIDGSSIPLWLKSRGRPEEPVRADDQQHGYLHRTRLRTDMPDMIEIDAEWVRSLEEVCEFVSLDSTLRNLAASCKPHVQVEIDANYAYTEGVDAEELSRANTRAETALLTFESAEALLGPAVSDTFDISATWKVFLKAQHHDAYWTGAPELRAKSIAQLNELTQAVNSATNKVVETFSSGLPDPGKDRKTVMVFHPYAKRHQTPVTLKLESSDVSLTDDSGSTVPFQLSRDKENQYLMTFISSLKGAGYRTLFIQPSNRTGSSASQPFTAPYSYSNDYYSITANEDGTISQLSLKNSDDLLKGARSNNWLYSKDGGDIFPKALKDKGRVIKGPVYDAVETTAESDSLRMESRITLYHELPWFDIETRLIFNEPAEIGDYFDDRTKLHFAWDCGTDVEIKHAVGGCPAEAEIGRTFLVYPWLKIDMGPSSLAFCMFNAAKCMVDEEGKLRCVVGWGHNGKRFHNRQGPLPGIMGPLNWIKEMDLRLRGEYVIRYSVWPHSFEVSTDEIADWSASLLLPPTAFALQPGKGDLPWSQTFIEIDDEAAIPLSLRPAGENEAVFRMAAGAKACSLSSINVNNPWEMKSCRNLNGTEIGSIDPYQIVEILCRKKAD